jgi:nucleotide-binding universal stress UspA family protein
MSNSTIVTLVDFSGMTPQLMAQSEKYAKALNARVILLHIHPKDTTLRDKETSLADYKILTDLGAALSKTGVNVLVEQLNDADHRRTLDECRMWDAELIIVGSHHHGFLHNWFVKCFTCEMHESAHCPVLVLPAPPAA